MDAQIAGLLGSFENQQPMNGLLDLNKYEALTANNKNLQVDYVPLNFEALLKSGALRVTHQGLQDGSYNQDPKAGFSLVSAYNDVAGDQSKQWKNNPLAYETVKNMLMESPQNIGPYKYMQIIQSARDLGLSDKDIFLR
jgi:hypothetical protein